MQGKKIVEIYTSYLPRPTQDIVHKNPARFKVLAWHRRCGKTVMAVNEIIDQALRCSKKNPTYAYVAPTFGSAKRVSWDYFKDFTKDIPGVETNESDLTIRIPRPALGDQIKIMLLGSENPGAIRGVFLDGCVVDEHASSDPTVFSQVIRPALSDRRGWAIIISTPKGRNHFWDLFNYARAQMENGDPDWFASLLPASVSGILPKDELEAAKAMMSEEEYLTEYEVDFQAALIGAYYSKEITAAEKENRITKVPYDKAVPVDTYWDLGISDTTAIWLVQAVGQEFHFIDYIEQSGVGLDWYVRELQKRGFIYYEHVLPHDAAARELGTGKSREETLRDLGLGRIRILERQDFADGIHAARMVFNKCWFDSDKCKKGLDALRAYEKKWDAKNSIFSDRPLHNYASHAADAFRYFALGNRGPVYKKNSQNLPSSADSNYDIWNMGG